MFKRSNCGYFIIDSTLCFKGGVFLSDTKQKRKKRSRILFSIFLSLALILYIITPSSIFYQAIGWSVVLLLWAVYFSWNYVRNVKKK